MSSGLGDLFPEGFLDQHAQNKVVAESIIVLEIPHFNLNYDKFVVLMTSSLDGDEICATCINTNPSPMGNHVKITPQEYGFLKHDSHIDCGSIVHFKKEYLKNLLLAEPHRYKGNLAEAEYIDVLLKLSQSDTIADEDVEKFNL